MVGTEIIVEFSVNALAVVIVGIDHREGGIDVLPGCQHRLAGTPGLCTALRQNAGNIRQGLEAVAHLNAMGGAHFFDPVSDDLPEVFFNIPADDKHNFIESRLNGVVNGIVHDDMTGFVHLGQLLDPAPIAAADPGCHDNQSCLFQRGVLLFAQTKNRQGFFL